MHASSKRLLKFIINALFSACLASPVHAAAMQAAAGLADDEGVGVVLGGGGARGFAHLGVLKELERLHVPIRCIAGTSAGALIGGMYANGLPLDEMQKDFREADWGQLLSGRLPREELPYDKKRNDYKNYLDVTFGLQGGQLRVPRSAINSQEIEMFIRRLTRDRQLDSYDQLPIPFRALATDLASGDAVVFDKGPLAVALRASMAVPGLFDLVETDNRLLVDGGLARNLPIQDVRSCAKNLIVVDVGSPPLKKEEINSLFDVVAQTSNLMVSRNVAEQMRLMHKGDVLIKPDLNGYTAADFADNQAIIARGEAAAVAQSRELARFSVSLERYASWQARLVPPSSPVVDEVKVADGVGAAASANVQGAVKDLDGPVSIGKVRQRLRDIFASGDYDRIAYEVDEKSGRNVMTVMPVERSIGSSTLHMGLTLQSTTPGDSSFGFLLSHEQSQLNRAGASWRNEALIGNNKLYKTELYQPFSFGSPFFAAASLSYQENPFPLYSNHIKFAEVTNEITMTNVDLGTILGRYGEFRLGLYDARVHSYLSMGDASLLPGGETVNYRGLRARLVIDQFDNPRWPRSGYFLNTEFTGSLPWMGSHTGSTDYSAVLEGAHTFGDITVRATGKLSGNLGRDVQDFRLESLGGFLNLTGYQHGELLGSRAALGRVMVYWRAASLPSILGSGLYAGGSVEMGKVWSNPFTGANSAWIPAGSLFVAADTILGPFFIGVGDGKNGKLSGYLYLGTDY